MCIIKSNFYLLIQAYLRFITLFSIVINISCSIDAPRIEPMFLGYDIDSKNLSNSFKDPDAIQTTTNYLNKPLHPGLPNLNVYYTLSKDDVVFILKKVGCFTLLNQLRLGELTYSKQLEEEILLFDLVLSRYDNKNNDFTLLLNTLLLNRKESGLGHDVIGQVSKPTLSKLPNRLGIVVQRPQKNDSSNAGKLVGVESITINANPLLANSDKYSLTGFLIHRPTNVLNGMDHNRIDHLVAFEKSGQEWSYYNDGKTNTLSNEQAITLALESGAVFFYQKIAG